MFEPWSGSVRGAEYTWSGHVLESVTVGDVFNVAIRVICRRIAPNL